jgi:hypothetical protein
MCQHSFFIILREMLYRYVFRPFCWAIFRRTQYSMAAERQYHYPGELYIYKTTPKTYKLT